jgi:CHAD domain-containing protein
LVTIAAVLRARLEEQVAAIREHAPKVYAHGDAEELHKLRVAVRRLRALLRTLRSRVEDQRCEALRAELGTLGRTLGPARDGDVFKAYLEDETAAIDEPGADVLLDHVESQRLEAYAAARAALDDPGFLRLLEELDAFCATAEIPELDGVVAVEAKKLRKAMEDVASNEALHAARIKAKRVRYAAEAKGEKRVVRHAKRLQDVVGEHQDAVVAEQRLRDLAEPETAILVGRLIERQAERRRRAREATPGAWKKLALTL